MGYWLPHTSSIDFCETNYLLSHHVVEPHNVWSSLAGISAFGLLGLSVGNPTGEWRFTLAYLMLVLIGVGSAGLHGSLHWVFQSSDELPMLYMNLCLAYACAEVDAPRGKPHYPWLPAFLSSVAVANTLFYYTFQQLYWVFLMTFVIYLTITIVWKYRLIFFTPGRGPAAKRVEVVSFIGFALLGTPSWVFDMRLCDDYVLPVANALPCPLRGMTPHVLWHISAGLGGYCSAIELACCRTESLGIEYEVSYLLGFVPKFAAVPRDVKAAMKGKVKGL